MSNALSNDDFLAKWLNGDLSEEDLKALQEKYNLDDLKKVLEGMNHLSPPAMLTKEEAWTRLQGKMEEDQRIDETPVVPLFGRMKWMATAAAAVVLIFAGYFFLRDSRTIITTPDNYQMVHYLPDSSRVILNADSRLAYQEDEWEDKRSLTLEGEAYFEVRKGEKFTVHTAKGSVSVLGTRFNVYARKLKSEVICYEGKVRVKVKDDQSDLTAGMAAKFYDGDRLEVVSLVIPEKPEWSQGKFSFHEENFDVVIEELERQYGIEVDYAEENRTYTGAFFENDLENALLLVCEPMGLTYTFIDSTHIRLARKP